MRLHVDARKAELWLEPRLIDGQHWRAGWGLLLTRGAAELWTLFADGAPVLITEAAGGPIMARLVVRRRTLQIGSEAPCKVRLEDRAFNRHTTQSSAQAYTPERALVWSLPTQPEPAPYWEIDLARGHREEGYFFPDILPSITIDLADVPAGAKLRVKAYAYATPDGSPPPCCWTFEPPLAPPDASGLTRVEVALGGMARRLRVELRGARGEALSLSVVGLQAQGAEVFGESLRDTWRRAFALFRDRTMVMARKADGAPFEPVLTYGEVARRSLALACALARRLEGRYPGRIFFALATRNRPEWIMADVAAVERGYVVVPLAPDEPEERLRIILARCQPAALLIEATDLERLGRIAHEVCSALLVVCDGAQEAPLEGQVSFEALLREGEAREAPPPASYDEKDLYTILFTSGSTGGPKGAMRSYAAFHEMISTYGMPHPAFHLSFQPLGHVSERMYLPSILVRGATVAFSHGALHLMDELSAFEPTELSAVPRLFDLLYAAYQRRLRTADPAVPRARVEAEATAEARHAFGRRLASIGVGSAPVSPEVLAFLKRVFADIWVFEGYGTTEHGSIAIDGRLSSGVEIKLVPLPDDPEHREIWVRSPHMISGYFGDETASAAAIDHEGFFRTGDLGELGADGALRVTGRRASAVKLAQGEFVSAERVESALSTSPLVDRVFVLAEAGAASVVALVFPRREALAALLGVGEVSLAELVQRPGAASAALSELRSHGAQVGLVPYELPAVVFLDPAPPSVQSGLLTPSDKLARATLAKRVQAKMATSTGGTTSLVASAQGRLGVRDGTTSLRSLTARLVACAAEALGRPVTEDEPLAGSLDSLAAADLLASLSRDLGQSIDLPDWFASRSLADLAARLKRDPSRGSTLYAEAARELAQPLILPPWQTAARAAPRTLLLTGATGFLGAHLVEALLERSSLEIVCLVRAGDDEQARHRLHQALSLRGIVAPSEQAGGASRLRALAGDLAAPWLGLGEARFGQLAEQIDAILHAGAVVSWLAPYASLQGPNVAGTRALLALASPGRARHFHFVSTISTAPADGDEASFLSLEASAQTSPYALSKWLAEHHVRTAAERGLPVTIYRPAMIAPHSERGTGNPDDFIARYLAGCIELGRYIAVSDQRLDMTPVDFVARAIVALLGSPKHHGQTYHLTNIEQSFSYERLGRAMIEAGVPLVPTDYASFRAALRQGRGGALGALAPCFPDGDFALGMGPWPSLRSRQVLASLGVRCPPIDGAMVRRQIEGLRAPRGTGKL